jgi:hypothetical protein
MHDRYLKNKRHYVSYFFKLQGHTGVILDLGKNGN